MFDNLLVGYNNVMGLLVILFFWPFSIFGFKIV
jgi:hypothetical protein